MRFAPSQHSGPPSPHRIYRIYRFGRFELQTRSGELLRNGHRIRLQEQPRRILSVLLENAGDLVERDQLHQSLWPADTFVDFDIGLNAAMRKLRIALDERIKNPLFIETLSRRGYRFIAPVAVFEVDAAQQPPQLFPAGAWLAAVESANTRSTIAPRAISPR
ncbi:Adenylate cyclase [Acidisarcina polymorpha]|uniref:Adenylate cyclase n=1 Tax=Acidisarcina polymorpha TaxID=2211140 RepID=A0A2Z5G577_9BACT|nr:winged helix-turn-helix domain-containing protein [Acidisarcina polymorpha]AXC13696.1 Adenylate cyclase [Acidisarcina polymorpha]